MLSLIMLMRTHFVTMCTLYNSFGIVYALLRAFLNIARVNSYMSHRNYWIALVLLIAVEIYEESLLLLRILLWIYVTTFASTIFYNLFLLNSDISLLRLGVVPVAISILYSISTIHSYIFFIQVSLLFVQHLDEIPDLKQLGQRLLVNHAPPLSLSKFRLYLKVIAALFIILFSSNESSYSIQTVASCYIVENFLFFFFLKTHALIVSQRFNAFSHSISTAMKRFLFWLFGWMHGYHFINITDVDMAVMILKSSVDKGVPLERCVAMPAWAPILSLESVEGPLWKAMRHDFDKLLTRCIPPVAKLQEIALRNIVALKSRLSIGSPITAEVIEQLTVATFIEFVFDEPWKDTFQVFIEAAREWRKELSMRGKGDKEKQRRAIRLLVEDLLCPSVKFSDLIHELTNNNQHSQKKSHLSDSTLWYQARYFSLILQPFIISPCINVGDILVSVELHPELSLEEALCFMHPFPILERYVHIDLFDAQGQLVVAKNTQVAMFTADFAKVVVASKALGKGSGMDSKPSADNSKDQQMISSHYSLNMLTRMEATDCFHVGVLALLNLVLRCVEKEDTIMEETMNTNNSVSERSSHDDGLSSPCTTTRKNTSLPWAAFGAGPRMCAGKHLALPFLHVVVNELRNLRQHPFKPSMGHLYSGRHLDGTFASFSEAIYFVSTVIKILCLKHPDVTPVPASTNSMP
jgi:hypothetical protein